MADSNEETTAVSPKTKLEKINSFCESFGCDVKKIIQYIIEKLNDLPDKYITLIDILWKSMKGLTARAWKSIIVEAIKILGYVLSFVGLTFPMVGVASRVLLLVASFLKIIFRISDLKVMLKPDSTEHESLMHDMAGLAERLERTASFIDAVDVEEHVDESTLHSLISNVDIHIGVEQIGSLKSRIQTLMAGGQEDWHACLHFLKLFVKLSTLRHSLLFRMMACLKTKDFSLVTINALQMYMEKERNDNQAFLTFFYSSITRERGSLVGFSSIKARRNCNVPSRIATIFTRFKSSAPWSGFFNQTIHKPINPSRKTISAYKPCPSDENFDKCWEH